MAFNLSNLTTAANSQKNLQMVRRQFKLDPETDRELDLFQVWCELRHTRGTAQSYRSLVAKVCFYEIPFEKQTSSQRSAMSKFDDYIEAHPERFADDDES